MSDRKTTIRAWILAAIACAAYALSTPAVAQSMMARAAEQGRAAAQDSAQAHYIRAARLAQQGRYGPAIAAMHTAIEFLPNEPQLKVELAVLQAAIGDFDGAVSTLKPVAEKSPPYPLAVMQLGDLYLSREDTAQANAQYRRLTKGPEPFPPAFVRLGDVMQSDGRRNQAIRMYREALRIDPEYVEAYLRIGSVYIVEDRYGQAMEMFNAAVNIAPEDQVVNYMRMLAEQRKADFEEGMAQNMMRARIIVVETEAEVADIRRQLDAGADFIALAVNESIHPSAEVGGDLGFFGPGDMIPVFENTTARLRVGQYSQPVRIPSGWAIVMRAN